MLDEKKIGTSEVVEVTELKDMQNLLYGMMKDLHDICQRHNLYYVIFAGTMLGAIRHQAIIPWDDDIDICMPRGDYEKFCRIINKQYSEKYTVKVHPQENYAYPFAKFCLNDSLLIETMMLPKYSRLMLYIDVFPLDGYPSEDEETKHFKKIRHYKSARCMSVMRVGVSRTWWKKPYALVHYLRFLPYRLIGYEHFLKKELEETERYDYNASEILSIGDCFQKGKIEKSVFENRRLYSFGALQLWGIADYDAHLTRLYGDYMTPPPMDKRVTHHFYKLYVKSKI